MAEKALLSHTGAGGEILKNKLETKTFHYFDDMEKILGQRSIVTSLSNINSGMSIMFCTLTNINFCFICLYTTNGKVV